MKRNIKKIVKKAMDEIKLPHIEPQSGKAKVFRADEIYDAFQNESEEDNMVRILIYDSIKLR